MRFNKGSFLSKFPRFSDSLPVYCSDGKKLGSIGRTDDESFTVEKGVFFPKDFTLRYDDIDQVVDDRVIIRETSAEMEKWQDEKFSGWSKVERVNAVSDVEGEGLARIPVYEEELEARKIARKTGEVSVRKIVHTELKHLTVPLIHEEVRIERVAADHLGRAEAADDAFGEKTVTVSLMDEEVEVAKRPVLREEVRVGKIQRTEQRDVSGEIRKEEVEIDDRTAKGRERKAG